MARFLLATTPVSGHVTPATVLARRLVERGHQVGWYTGAGFAEQVKATGARHYPIRHSADWSIRHPHDAVPELRNKTGLAQVRLAFQHLFIDAAPASLADLEAIVDEVPADVVVANALVFADRWLHERGGPVHANLATTMYGLYSRDAAPFGLALPPSSTPLGRLRNRALNAAHRKLAFAPVNHHLDEVRAGVGLPRQGRAVIDTFLSPYLYLQDTVPSFEYPRSDLPPQVHFIGPLLPGSPAEFPAPPWWSEVTSGRPVVLVTQGTVRNEDALLFTPTVEALTDEEMLVIITTGGGPVTLPAPLPSNVRVIDFIPYAALMPHVTVYVTNGGYGGVHMALAHGVPLVVAGATEDKPEVAARVAWSGAGIKLGGRPSAARVRQAVRRVIQDPTYRTNAARLAADIATHRPADRAAELLERLAATRRPVLRGIDDPKLEPAAGHDGTGHADLERTDSREDRRSAHRVGRNVTSEADR